MAVSNLVKLSGGSGGVNSDLANSGGEGGSAEIRSGSFTAGSLSLSGGSGGLGNVGAEGGNGGAALVRVTSLDSAGAISLSGGAGASGWAAGGGAGGKAQLVTTDNLNALGNNITLVSGANGTGGSGGAASLLVGGVLHSDGLQVTKNGGDIDVNVAAIHVGSGDTFRLVLDGTSSVAGNSVYFGTVRLNSHSIWYTGLQNGASYTWNTLEVNGKAARWQGSNLDAAGKHLLFILPANVQPGDTMLEVNGAANITGSAVSMRVVGSAVVQEGDTFTLIHSDALTSGTLPNTITASYGSKFLDFEVFRDTVDLWVRAGSYSSQNPRLNPQFKALAEGNMARLAFLDSGQDMLLGNGLNSAEQATQEKSFAAFGAVSGGFSRYTTGSHVDVQGAHMVSGVAWRSAIQQHGDMLVAPFFEVGTGSYDSYNSFANDGSVKGRGDMDYYGAGLFTRYVFTQHSQLKGIYVEASARIGRASTDFKSHDLLDTEGNRVSYEFTSSYYGVHGGLGYMHAFSQYTDLDVYTKYLWTRQKGNTGHVGNEPLTFSPATSQRWRTGARLQHAFTEFLSPYAGAAYEYEFDGKGQASISGQDLDAPSLGGGTIIGEIGFTYRPSVKSSFSADFGMQAYTGIREGLGGSLQLKWTF